MNMNDVSINIDEIVSGDLTKSILEENADIIEKWFLFYLKDKLIAKQCFRISYDMFIGKENFVIEEGADFLKNIAFLIKSNTDKIFELNFCELTPTKIKKIKKITSAWRYEMEKKYPEMLEAIKNMESHEFRNTSQYIPKIYKKVVMSMSSLFYLSPEHIPDLNQNKLTKSLRDDFIKNNRRLSYKVSAYYETKNYYWEIISGRNKKKKRYAILKKKNEINLEVHSIWITRRGFFGKIKRIIPRCKEYVDKIILLLMDEDIEENF